jgi:transcription elongation factor Elf1
MRVEPRDGVCRNCSGVLSVVDADDATMTVECEECGDSYQVEPDAFGDGCMIYYLEFMTSRQEDRDE